MAVFSDFNRRRNVNFTDEVSREERLALALICLWTAFVIMLSLSVSGVTAVAAFRVLLFRVASGPPTARTLSPLILFLHVQLKVLKYGPNAVFGVNGVHARVDKGFVGTAKVCSSERYYFYYLCCHSQLRLPLSVSLTLLVSSSPSGLHVEQNRSRSTPPAAPCPHCLH